MRDESSAHDEVTIALDAAQPSGAGVGVAVDVGARSAALRGQRVLVGAFDPCGACEVCRAGSVAACPRGTPRGAPANRRVRASSRWLVELGDGLELPVPAAAAVAGDVALAYTLYARASLAPREPVVVVGGNAIARFLVDILRAKSIAPILVVDDTSAWRDEPASRGVSVAGSATAHDDVAAAIAAQGVGSRPRRVLATEPSAIALACELAGARATLALVSGRDTPALPGQLFAREVCVIGVAGPHPDLMLEAAALCARGDIDLVGGVSEDPADRTRATVVRAAKLP
jgi:D-arabinose 1-dehydrogenase-like Zn-dependent alcohol dehydrogenase